MTAADLLDAVRDDQQTELSRLGSSKTLYADTRGEMEPDVVLAAAAAREGAAHDTFDAWSDDDHDDAAALFADAAGETAERRDSLDADPVDRTPAMHDVLDDLDGTVERLGGFVGWALVDKKVKEQYTGFFTGQADPQTASTFRSAGSDVEALREEAAELLDAVCEDDDDWDAAEAVAIEVIATAYDTFDAWGDDDHDDAAALFADAAGETAERRDSIDADSVDRTPAMHGVLADLDGTVERLGGFVGWALVDKKVKEQYTGFFTGQADPQTASTFRSAGSDVEALREEAAELLDAVCEDGDDWDVAEAAAIEIIATAYDEYFETLEDLGVNPKPVC